MACNRRAVERAVSENPGISFTGLKSETGLSNGVLQYHIRNSEEIERKKGALMERGHCEKCEHQGDCGQKCLKMVERKPVNRRIIDMKEEGLSHTTIAGELDICVSTVSYHVSKLEELGLLD